MTAGTVNHHNGTSLRTLLFGRHGEDVNITEEVARAAVQNEGGGLPVVRCEFSE